MFGNDGAAALGFQLSMYRLLDTLEETRQANRETVLRSRLSNLCNDYNRLLTYAQGVERDLQQRNTQLAGTQAELAGARQQLAAARQELGRSRAEVTYLQRAAYEDMTIRQNLERERERRRDLRSQSD